MAADDGPRRDEPLAASIGEELRAKAEREAAADQTKRAEAAAQERTERRKADERAEVARHLEAEGVAPAAWPARRAAARAHGRVSAARRDWAGRGLPVLGLGLALVGYLTRRRWLVLGGLPLTGFALLLAPRLPAR